MKIYILDDFFFYSTTDYTGEELIVYPVQLNLLEIRKLKKLGIQYTTDSAEAGKWIKHIETIKQRDFGGIMIKGPSDAKRLIIPWEDLQEIKEASMEESKKGGRSI